MEFPLVKGSSRLQLIIIVLIRRKPHDWHTRVHAASSMRALREGQAAC